MFFVGFAFGIVQEIIQILEESEDVFNVLLFFRLELILRALKQKPMITMDFVLLLWSG